MAARAVILKSETYNFHRLDLTRQAGGSRFHSKVNCKVNRSAEIVVREAGASLRQSDNLRDDFSVEFSWRNLSLPMGTYSHSQRSRVHWATGK